ncbi:hypothetical protein PtB15_16B351 [Puccinia triticina]|nr:hypothetical protein PtB15_16B351 [Puccinia triticina]
MACHQAALDISAQFTPPLAHPASAPKSPPSLPQTNALRIIATARGIIQEASSVTTPRSMTFNPTCSVTTLLAEAEKRLFNNLNDNDFSSVKRTRLIKWKKHRKAANGESLTRLLESDNPVDYTLLCFALSSIFSTSLRLLPATVSNPPLQPAPAALSPSLRCGRCRRPLHRHRHRAQSRLGRPQPLHFWSSLLISVTSITTSTDPKTGNLSPTIDTLSNTSQSASARERNISPGEDLIKTLVPFLTSEQPPFREAAIRAMSSIHVSMYPTLLEGLLGLAHHLTSERKMIEAQKDRSARPNGTVKIIRLFSAIGKLHKSTTKLLFHPDYRIADRTVDILATFSRETCIFLKSQQHLDDLVSLSIRKSFLIFAKRLLRKTALLRPSSSPDHPHLFPKELFIDFYNLAEDWSTRAISSSSLQPQSAHANLSFGHPPGSDPHPSRSGSMSSRANVPQRGRPSASSTTISGDLLPASASMIATLCESYLDVRVASGSQNRPKSIADRPRISVSRLLRWIVMLFKKNDPKSHVHARRAFIGSVRNSSESNRLLEAALTLCWNESSKAMPLLQTLFGVLGNALISDPSLQIRDSALLVICLARLTHSDLTMRQQAIDLLKARGMLGTQLDLLSDVEVNLASAFAGQHLAAQFRTSATVCSLRKVAAVNFILELGSRIIQTDPQNRPADVVILASDWKNVYPSEVSLDTFVSLVHFILYWQLDYGTDFVLRTLLTYANDANENNQGLVAQTGAERIMIGITSSLRALTSLEKAQDPPYPTQDHHQPSKNSSNPHIIYDPNYSCRAQAIKCSATSSGKPPSLHSMIPDLKSRFAYKPSSDLTHVKIHAWDYRRYVILRIKQSQPLETLDAEELAFSGQQIKLDQYDQAHDADCGQDQKKKEDILAAELEWVRGALWIDPNDQSAWLFHHWLLSQTQDKQILAAKHASIAELLEVEPDAKWAIAALIRARPAEHAHLLERLITLDPLRRQRYLDLVQPNPKAD